MSDRLTRFLGDTPLRVFVRLVILSFVVGLLMTWFNIYPFQVYAWLETQVMRIYNMGFAVFGEIIDYLAVGALVVVPLFLLSRLFKLGSGRRT